MSNFLQEGKWLICSCSRENENMCNSYPKIKDRSSFMQKLGQIQFTRETGTDLNNIQK
jgi:hypothetical protein